MFFVKKSLAPLRFAAILIAFVAGALYAGGSDDETEGVVACAAQSGWPFLAVQRITQLPILNLTATFCLQSDASKRCP